MHENVHASTSTIYEPVYEHEPEYEPEHGYENGDAAGAKSLLFHRERVRPGVWSDPRCPFRRRAAPQDQLVRGKQLLLRIVAMLTKLCR